MIKLNINVVTDGETMKAIQEGPEKEHEIMVTEGRGPPEVFYSLDILEFPYTPLSEPLREMAHMHATSGIDQTKWPLHVTMRFGQNGEYERGFKALGPQRTVLSTIWVLSTGTSWVTATLAPEASRLFEEQIPHV